MINSFEDMSLKEFLSDASPEIKEACKAAGLSDGKIVSSDSTDPENIENYVKNSKKLKDFGQGTSLYESLDGSKFVYHSENGSEALYLK